MSALRASLLVGDSYPDLTVGAIACRRFAPHTVHADAGFLGERQICRCHINPFATLSLALATPSLRFAAVSKAFEAFSKRFAALSKAFAAFSKRFEGPSKLFARPYIAILTANKGCELVDFQGILLH
jgi:hypothetical protein